MVWQDHSLLWSPWNLLTFLNHFYLSAETLIRIKSSKTWAGTQLGSCVMWRIYFVMIIFFGFWWSHYLCIFTLCLSTTLITVISTVCWLVDFPLCTVSNWMHERGERQGTVWFHYSPSECRPVLGPVKGLGANRKAGAFKMHCIHHVTLKLIFWWEK